MSETAEQTRARLADEAGNRDRNAAFASRTPYNRNLNQDAYPTGSSRNLSADQTQAAQRDADVRYRADTKTLFVDLHKSLVQLELSIKQQRDLIGLITRSNFPSHLTSALVNLESTNNATLQFIKKAVTQAHDNSTAEFPQPIPDYSARPYTDVVEPNPQPPLGGPVIVGTDPIRPDPTLNPNPLYPNPNPTTYPNPAPNQYPNQPVNQFPDRTSR